jgi:GT2 family glycosyltransferase
MKYSVVMNSFTRREDHKDMVLGTIASVKGASKDYEFIIVDDGSTIPTGFMKKEADIYVRHNPHNKGIAPCWNNGKNVSRGEYVVIINDDIRVPEGWLETMSSVFEKDEKVGVVGTMVAGPDVTPGLLDGEHDINHKWTSGYCFMFKRDRFMEDFDEQFVPFNFEDIDMWERVLQAGFKIAKAPLAIFHAEGDTIHEMKYDETESINLQRFIKKWDFNPKEKYFGAE